MKVDENIAKFFTEVIKPWETLNRALIEQSAVEKELSDLTRQASLLAVAIKHIADYYNLDKKSFASRSKDWALMSDVADSYKHRLLSKASRANNLMLTSHFEADGNRKFRFIHNCIDIYHKTAGKLEFLTVAEAAIQFLINELTLTLQWSGKILEAPIEFSDVVTLHAGSKHQVRWESIQLYFCKRNESGELLPYDPPKWEFKLTSTID